MIQRFMSRAAGFFLAFSVLLLSCAKEDLEVTYIYVPAFDVQPNGQSGDISTKISDVRVVIGAQSLGFYPLPARIPILESGDQLVRLEPVVRIAGLAANRIVYPFYEVFEETLTLVPGTTDTVRPEISYISTATFGYVEDFETSANSLTLDLDDYPDTRFARVTSNPSSGSGAGMATLTGSSRIIETATPALNTGGDTWNRVWLEMDYRGDIPLTVAILPEELGSIETRIIRYEQGASDREDWIKLYFELIDNGLAEFASQPFRVGFLAANDTTEIASAEIFLDNIKVVYQK